MFMAFITCKCARETLVLSTRGGAREPRYGYRRIINVRDPPREKNIAKKFRKCLEVMFYSTTFAPAFEREQRYRNSETNFS